MDTLTPEQRSKRMSLVKSKDTAVELRVRRLVYAMGYRYRLHRKDLPGKPDMVFTSRRAAIFIHGCFWHRHEGCKLARLPKSKLEFWREKLETNKARDKRNLAALAKDGWRTLVVWECETKNLETLAERLRRFLNGEEK
jgi:DNA mismatch endonuclease (patch repair protein)